MEKVLLTPTALQNVRIEDNFYPQAKKLRKAFDDRFANPLRATPERFCWDYWLVPQQYKLLRTPAEAFFGDKLFQPFLAHLLQWGRENLGCQMISHPWLSLYLDGCYQSLHSDVPHGPWSFVYSLTPWSTRTFRGGETLLAKPKLLRYFQEVSHEHSDEHENFFQKIEPAMNRLTVFDPRYPHGVQEVKGEEDLLKGRLVIHGWFTEPRPMLAGALTFKQILKSLDQLANHLIQQLEPSQFYGLLSLKFRVQTSGKIQSTEVLCGHLVNGQGDSLPMPLLKTIIRAIMEGNEIQFPKARGMSTITLPIEFKR
jgi:hypothetical protein